LGSGEEHQSVSWQDGAPPELEEALRRSLDATACDDGSDDIRWVCPRCRREQFLNVVRDQVWAGLSGGTRTGEVALRCECRYDHAGRPEGEVGCGYRVFIAVDEQEE
jgi:hypothetical protein